MVQQVAQVAQATPTGWVALVASSAVIGAVIGQVISAISNWLLKIVDAVREKEKKGQVVAHVKLEIMDQLESFANRCANFMYDIEECMEEHYRHVPEAFSNVQRSIPFKFEPAPKWVELPVPFVAPIKALSREYDDTGDWINRTGLWADTADQYRYELERLAFYGLKALAVADSIREDIKAGNGGTVQLEASRSTFTKEIAAMRERYKATGGEITVIPELEALFEREMPDLKAATLREKKADEL
ncbi:hypothetical protein G5S35_38285 [Paraburkholderia tropica]|uniref:hypothetical protein n=1 Tax=Paraburkholderia tropica TaxID=92647 RepID=UPI0015FF4331|nr:hypothetical protein [Paraburkholderia tropica]QNB17441.1 hypothetical protein G5S35_38285 [Paraburkholderia tropica]